MEEVAVYKKEASDERLRRIESEEMVNSYQHYHDKHFYLKKLSYPDWRVARWPYRLCMHSLDSIILITNLAGY